VYAGVIAGLAALFWSYSIQSTRYATSTSIVATGQLPSTSLRNKWLVEALPIELPTEAGTGAELCRYILETNATQRQVVAQCSLQEGLGATSQQDAAQQLGNCTQTTLESPNIVILAVVLPGPSRLAGLFNRARTAPTAQLTVRVVEAYLKVLSERLTQLHLTAAKRKRVFLEEGAPAELAGQA